LVYYAPSHEIEGCDGIFYRRVADVGSTRLNSPSEVLFDSRNDGSDYASQGDGSIVGGKETYKSRSARLYGGPAGCRKMTAVSTFRGWIIRNVLRSFSRACPIRIVSELMSSSNDLRISTRGCRADVVYISCVIPENRVLKSL